MKKYLFLLFFPLISANVFTQSTDTDAIDYFEKYVDICVNHLDKNLPNGFLRISPTEYVKHYDDGVIVTVEVENKKVFRSGFFVYPRGVDQAVFYLKGVMFDLLEKKGLQYHGTPPSGISIYKKQDLWASIQTLDNAGLIVNFARDIIHLLR